MFHMQYIDAVCLYVERNRWVDRKTTMLTHGVRREHTSLSLSIIKP